MVTMHQMLALLATLKCFVSSNWEEFMIVSEVPMERAGNICNKLAESQFFQLARNTSVLSSLA